jgi:hypothetical protein
MLPESLDVHDVTCRMSRDIIKKTVGSDPVLVPYILLHLSYVNQSRSLGKSRRLPSKGNGGGPGGRHCFRADVYQYPYPNVAVASSKPMVTKSPLAGMSLTSFRIRYTCGGGL